MYHHLHDPIPPQNVRLKGSTLRHVKTWLRSTMTEQRLSGQCILSILSIHRQKIDDLNVIQNVVNEFSKKKGIYSFYFKVY